MKATLPPIGVLSVQQEYGIFGGKRCPSQRRGLEELARLSAAHSLRAE